MFKKRKIFGLLLGILFSVTVVYAATALSKDEFKEKMKKRDYVVTDLYGYVTASKTNGAETYNYLKFDDEDAAKSELDRRYKEAKKEEKESLKDEAKKEGISYKIKCKNCESDASGDTGYIVLDARSTKGDDEYYAIAYRVGDTIIAATGSDKDAIVDTMKDLGYYSSETNIFVYVIVGAAIGAIVGVVVLVIMKMGKGNNAKYGQPMNNFGQPVNNQPMNQGMNFGQPVNNQPMNQGMNFNQPVNNQPINQGMNFNQPVNNQPMNSNSNNNQINNNFPNMN